ncbi:HAD family hydrolase [Mobilitalea sibirica]|uniref:HAD family hydrolase n=1 Tax=Mobilitalea sibirica TaxID=1462919 RepID=A0A8J7H962_9FIRM|nr:HAD family hydrolase [Mobilitalea sibirica]MBH1940820.1 HAD family hydrolase [Mobilitalea sibirica]
MKDWNERNDANIKYIFFDCMETLVDMVELPTSRDYAYWTYEGSGVEQYWLDKEEYWLQYKKAQEELLACYDVNEDYEICHRIRLTVENNTRIDRERKDIVAQKLYRNYWNNYRAKCYVNPDKKQALKELSQEYQLAVVSNFKVKEGIQELLESHDIREFFDFVIVSVDCGWRKPDKRIYEEAMKLAGCNEEEILFVGDDYENDYVIPRKLGMKAVYYDVGEKYRDCDTFSNFLSLKERIKTLGIGN